MPVELDSTLYSVLSLFSFQKSHFLKSNACSVDIKLSSIIKFLALIHLGEATYTATV